MRRLLAVLFGIGTVALAACGGGSGYTPAPTATPSAASSPAASGSIAFVFIVPPATLARHRSIVAPTGSGSVQVTLQTVNGTTTTAQADVVNLLSSSSGCETVNSQIVCLATLAEPSGSDVLLLKFYSGQNAGGTLISEGTVAVTVVSGQTTKAPVTTTGTVSKLSLALDAPAELGSPATVPLTVEALDASGAVIIGTYATPITLSDSDASAQTSISATSLADSTAASNVTLTYLGGAMASPATVTATSGSLSATAQFAPDQLDPATNWDETVNVTDNTYQTTQSFQLIQPVYFQNTYTTAVSQIADASFESLTGLTEFVNGGGNTPFTGDWFAVSPSFFTWSAANGEAQLGFVGGGSGTGIAQCTPPYQVAMEIPPGTWDARAGSGPCTYTYNNTSGTMNITENADGSYVYTSKDVYFVPNYDYTEYDATVNSDGSASYTQNTNNNGSLVMTIATPAPNSSTVAVNYATYSGLVTQPTVAPSPTTAPNIWQTMGLPNAQIPQPLFSDTYKTVGNVTIPGACGIPAGIIPATSNVVEIDESFYAADPTALNNSYGSIIYQFGTDKHYYVSGLGEVCSDYNRFYSELYSPGAQWLYLSSPTPDMEYYGMNDDIITSVATTTLQAALKQRSTAQQEAMMAAGLRMATRAAAEASLKHVMSLKHPRPRSSMTVR